MRASTPRSRHQPALALVLLSLVVASVVAGPTAEARRPMPRPTPASVYTDATTPRVRVDASSAAARGPADAPLTMVIFAEFQDPFIARVQPTLQLLEEQYGADLRMVFRHRPLDHHVHSRNAGRAAQEALDQGGATWFWAMHDKLLASQNALDVESLVTYARELGLDEQRLRQALGDGRHDAVIAADEAEAQRVGADGSPTFFVNGVLIQGAQPIEAFRAVLDAELALATRAIALGAGRQDIYRLAMAAPRETTPTPSAPTADAANPAPTAPVAPVFRVPVARDEPVRGAADALVTIVTFSDFQCPFCSRVIGTLNALEQRYGRDLRIVFRHNPLPFHPDAMPAAQAAVEAYAQRGDAGFWTMHDLLFQNQRALSRADLDRYAQQMGLDMRRFGRALDQGTHAARVQADMTAAAALGALGTPNFFINGRQLTGAQPEARFVEAIDRAMADAQALVSRGTPRRQVYARLIRDGRTSPVVQPTTGTGTAARGGPDPEAVYQVPVTRAQPVRGPANALVTLVLFTDFQCPFCSRIAPTLDAILQQYGNEVRLVFRNNPLPFHPNAMQAAEAAQEAFAQGGNTVFWRYHDLLFANQQTLGRADLERFAQQLGLDMPRFRQALDSGTHRQVIDADRALANQLGATGTPAVFVNGKHIRGAQPLAVFQARVDTELTAARALVRRGVPRARVYDRIIQGGATAPVLLPTP